MAEAKIQGRGVALIELLMLTNVDEPMATNVVAKTFAQNGFKGFRAKGDVTVDCPLVAEKR